MAQTHVKMLLLLVGVFIGQVASQLDCGVPGSVTQLEVSDLTSSTISLRWTPPTISEQCLSGYQVCWSAIDDGYPLNCVSLPADSTQVTLSELFVCANYTIEVATLGTSANSTAASLSTYSGAGPIRSASALTVNSTTLSVAWGYDVFTNGPCTSHFQMYVCESESEELAGCLNYTIPLQPVPEVFVTGLATCHQYFVSLFAIDYRGLTSDRNLLAGYVDGLGVATDISLTNVNSNEAFVSWVLPSVNAVCPHEPVVCHVREGGEARVCQSFQTETLTSFTLTELQACSSYSVQVIITTPGNYFAASPVQHITSSANTTMVLWAEAREVSDTQLTVAWLPLYNAPPCVREFSVCWTQEDATGGDCANAESSATSLLVTGLSPTTTYNLEVTAIFIDGSSSDTATTSATTAATTTATTTATTADATAPTTDATVPTTPKGSSIAVLGSKTTVCLLLSLLMIFKNHL